MSENKIFDDYEVDCNECQHYWDNACDAVGKGIKKNCGSYVATRRKDIPERIEKLEDRVERLGKYTLLLNILIILLSLGHIIF